MYNQLTLVNYSGRSASMKGTTGTAFAFGLQSGVGQLGGVIGPQIFRSRYAANGYKVPYGVCCGAVGIAFFGAVWCWYLTRDLETDVRRVHLERIKAKKEGKLFVGEDVRVDV